MRSSEHKGPGLIFSPKAKRLLTAVFAFLLIFQSGCAASQTQNPDDFVEIAATPLGLVRQLSSVPPQTRPDGRPFTIAYVDIDPFPPVGMTLYQTIMELRNERWISFDYLPFDPEDTDAGELINWLAEQDLGPYIRFDKSANYYTEFVSEDEIRQSLSQHVRSGSVDLIMTYGTAPAVLIKSFGLEVPVMMFGMVDPIGSGVIVSAEDSGDPNIWASVYLGWFERQLLVYHNSIPFKNLGIVYYDESVAALPSYESVADQLGFRVTRSKISRIGVSSEEAIIRYYENLAAQLRHMSENEGIDAFMLGTDLILHVEMTEYLLSPFVENNIPVFVQSGEQFVEEGALMYFSDTELDSFTVFSARSITAALGGTPLSEIPQTLSTLPHMSLNLDVAMKIGYRPDFETFLSFSRIYTLR